MLSKWRASDIPALLAAAFLVIIILMALAAPWLAPYDPTFGNLTARLLPPAWMDGGRPDYLLGTDHLGRDELSRIMYGARVSLAVGLGAVAFAGTLGTAVGIIAGYSRGLVDQIIMRIVDAWMAMPSLIFAIFLAAMVGPSAGNVILILGLVYWTRFARLVRGEVLSLRERDFVKLAIVSGASRWRIMLRHMLPNVVNTVLVLGTLTLGVMIVTEASLSFLGVGVPPPEPAWGLMLSEGKAPMMSGKWWLTVFPGLGIMLTVLAASVLGDWLRVKLDPKGKRR